MSETTVVHLMRHGEVHNPAGVLYGRIPDYHLSELGRKMAEVTAKYVTGPYELIELSGSHWLLEERPNDVADAIIRRIQSVEKVS